MVQEYQWYRCTNGTGVPMVILILYFNQLNYSGRAPLAHPLFSAPLVLAQLLGVPFYSFYLTKPVLFSAPRPLAHLLGVPKGVR